MPNINLTSRFVTRAELNRRIARIIERDGGGPADITDDEVDQLVDGFVDDLNAYARRLGALAGDEVVLADVGARA